MVPGSINDIGEWLHGLGLGHYEANFREHEIDADVLPELTEADLRRLGVALGSRKRMLKAIAELETGALSGAAPPAVGTAVERRPITVLSCRFEASSLPAQFDVEDWRDLYGGCVNEGLALVSRFGGRGHTELGDSLMATFGYPQAQENDAERAVRAALAIQLAIERLNTQLGCFCAQGHGANRHRMRQGRGRFHGRRSSARRRASPPAFRPRPIRAPCSSRPTCCARSPDCSLPRIGDPTTSRACLRSSNFITSAARPRAGRDARRDLSTPLVGRRSELDLLARMWERARSGAGRLALILGEPGMGKSRVLVEFRAMLSEIPHTWVHYNGSPLLQGSNFYPVTEWGRRRFDSATPPAERLAELEKTLSLIGLDAATLAPLVAPLVGVPFPPDRLPQLDPDELLRRQLAAAEAWILAGVRTQPAVLAFDDLQWCNSASLALLARLADRCAQAPLLIVATARPEFRAPWPSQTHHASLELAPLDRNDVRLMARALAAPRELSEGDLDVVNERSDGVPLYVEEIARLLLELGGEAALEAIPPALQQSLAARLDRLGEARQIAEIGAVLGREFDFPLLRDLADLPEAALEVSLDRLVEAGIFVPTGRAPNCAYRFKHALIRDAAYENLLRSSRRTLHLRAAELLRASSSPAGASEIVARHIAEADKAGQAMEEDAEEQAAPSAAR